jgi:hypothetical protein
VRPCSFSTRQSEIPKAEALDFYLVEPSRLETGNPRLKHTSRALGGLLSSSAGDCRFDVFPPQLKCFSALPRELMSLVDRGDAGYCACRVIKDCVREMRGNA